jgi:hypothetical protein
LVLEEVQQMELTLYLVHQEILLHPQVVEEEERLLVVMVLLKMVRLADQVVAVVEI